MKMHCKFVAYRVPPKQVPLLGKSQGKRGIHVRSQGQASRCDWFKQSRLIFAAFVSAVMFLAGPQTPLIAESPNEAWIRGTLDNLRIRLRGQVFYPDGRSADDIVAEGHIHANGVVHSIEPKIEGSQFEWWFPVNEQPWHLVSLRVASGDGEWVQHQQFTRHQIRRAAIDGIKLTLERPSRMMTVKVVHEGEPVAGTKIKIESEDGIDLRQRTDANGVANFQLLSTQVPLRIDAWTDDFRVGGFSLRQESPTDPDVGQYEVELSKCRDQRLRFVDQNGMPVPEIAFLLRVASVPDYDYFGITENSHLTTDQNGEVVYPWFPDWDRHEFYPQLQTRNWILDSGPEVVDGAAVFKLKKGLKRKRFVGRTETQGKAVGQGFFVTLRSFQGERNSHVDSLFAFSDQNGDFAMDVLPDATYCYWALDANYVSDVDHFIPYRSESDTTKSPTIAVEKGRKVKVFVTSGENEKPYSNLNVSLRREHHFSWLQIGETRRGSIGPQWRVKTGDKGIAETVSHPGKLKASVFTPLWRAETEVKVTGGDDPTIIRLHREHDKKRTVTGKWTLGKECDANLQEVQMKIAAVDGDCDDQQGVVVQQDGSFSFETYASSIGIFAITNDQKAASAMVTQDLDSMIDLQMHPTIDYQGKLIGDADQPLVGHRVWASVLLEGAIDYNRRASFSSSFEARRIETVTDSQGNYTLQDLPSKIKIGIRATSIDDPAKTRYLDDVFLQQGEERPVVVSRLGAKSSSAKSSLASRYESMIRDCSLMGFHMMVVVTDDEKLTNEFVAKNFVNYGVNKNNATYMQLVVAGNAISLPKDDVRFLMDQGFPLPEAGRLFACAIDVNNVELGRPEMGRLEMGRLEMGRPELGRLELGRLELDISGEDAAGVAERFVNQHAPKQLDAETEWKLAFEKAQDSQRVVWARVSQRYCGPCFKLARWLDDNRKLLSKDYVMLKIDDIGDKNGFRVAKRLTRGGQHGIPFSVIFDADQKVLVDSEGPLGNIGYPSSFEGKAHVRSMLLETRQRLTNIEIDQIVESLED